MRWLRKLLGHEPDDRARVDRITRALEAAKDREVGHAQRVFAERSRVVAAVRNTTAALRGH